MRYNRTSVFIMRDIQRNIKAKSLTETQDCNKTIILGLTVC